MVLWHDNSAAIGSMHCITASDTIQTVLNWVVPIRSAVSELGASLEPIFAHSPETDEFWLCNKRFLKVGHYRIPHAPSSYHRHPLSSPFTVDTPFFKTESRSNCRPSFVKTLKTPLFFSQREVRRGFSIKIQNDLESKTDNILCPYLVNRGRSPWLAVRQETGYTSVIQVY